MAGEILKVDMSGHHAPEPWRIGETFERSREFAQRAPAAGHLDDLPDHAQAKWFAVRWKHANAAEGRHFQDIVGWKGQIDVG